MKRSPLKRTSSLRRTPLRVKGKKSAYWHRSRTWTFHRANDRCEAKCCPGCTGRAEHAHHILMRSQGGADDPSNLLAVCWVCHDHIHRNPDESYAAGRLQRRAS